MDTIKLTHNTENNTIMIATPFDQETIGLCKQLGGKWNGDKKLWEVNSGFDSELRAGLVKIWGTDGDTPQKLVNVTLRLNPDTHHERCGALNIMGKLISKASGRDSGATCGSDVAFIKGGAASGGSAKNWESTVLENSVAKLLNVAKTKYEAGKNDYDIASVEDIAAIESSGGAGSDLADFTIAELRAEIAKRGG